MPARHTSGLAVAACVGALALVCQLPGASAQARPQQASSGPERLCIADAGRLKCRAPDGGWIVSDPDGDETIDTFVTGGGDEATLAACNERVNSPAKIEACTKVIRGGGGGAKSHAAAYFRRAKAHEAANEIDRAIGDYTEALRFNPELRQALNNRGDLHYQRKDYEAALADFNLAIGIDANYVHARRNRARVYHATGDDPSALDDLARVLADKPRDRKARFVRIEIYIAASNWPQAQEEIDLLLARRSKSGKTIILHDEVRAYAYRSEILGRQGDWQGASAAADEALKIDRNSIEAIRAKANASFQLKRYPEAIKFANDGLRIAPTDAVLLDLKQRATRAPKR